jgi:formate hydrogenlyase subunit 6/NADH:ubiquinone oxidoreductase subunit I
LEFRYDECIKCMCCHELCPHESVYLEKSRLARLIG